MSLKQTQESGKELEQFINLWKEVYPKQAMGGWWALTGFSFQMSTFLLRFFQGIEKGTKEPGQLAGVEILSDILCPKDGCFTLIQAKRTLNRYSLIKALREAYILTELCQKNLPNFVEKMRFQIACRKRENGVEIANISITDIIPIGGDELCWRIMLERFDKTQPIIEEPDTLGQLHVYLWSIGIRNTSDLIENCLGRILEVFGKSDPNVVRDLGRDLGRLFYEALSKKQNDWNKIGKLLTSEDVSPDPRASQYHEVLTGEVPRFEHLCKGFFKERQNIFNNLWKIYEDWLQELEFHDEGGKVKNQLPIFWIGGRSGTGKSILLIQLIARFIELKQDISVLHLGSGTQLPQLLNQIPEEMLRNTNTFGHLFVMIDDLYDIRDRDEWEEQIRDALAIKLPPIAIVTCGPSEQMDQLISNIGDLLGISSFDIPPVPEIPEFIQWYQNRSGKQRDISIVTKENTILVQLIFELAQGVSLQSFALRFKNRLNHLNLFNAARAILAVNSLYSDAPLSLISSDKQQDALESLCRVEQLHFRITTFDEKDSSLKGVRLAHPHLAWQLFIHWVEPPTTIERALARELAKTLEVMEDHNIRMRYGLLHQLLVSKHLSDDKIEHEQSKIARRQQVIRELYKAHIDRNNGLPAMESLSRWLELVCKIPDLKLNPDPIEVTVLSLSNDTVASTLPASVAAWLWVIAESRQGEKAEKLQNAVEKFLTTHSNNPGIGMALNRIVSLPGSKNSFKLAIKWLDTNITHTEAYILLSALVAKNPGDSEVKSKAIKWLDANTTHTEAYFLLSTLVANNPGDSEVKSKAIKWLDANTTHTEAYFLLSTLVSKNPGDSEVKSKAIKWLDANINHTNAFELLKALIARSNGDEELLQRGLSYLKQTGTKHHQNIIVVLLKAGNAEVKYVEFALHFLDSQNPIKHKQYVFNYLAGALSYKPERVFEYINGTYPDSRKDIICDSISIGLKHKPRLLHNCIKKLSYLPYSKYQAWILSSLIENKVESPELDIFLVNP